jgi:hypothetical protein
MHATTVQARTRMRRGCVPRLLLGRETTYRQLASACNHTVMVDNQTRARSMTKILMPANSVCWVKIGSKRKKATYLVRRSKNTHSVRLTEEERKDKKDDGLREVSTDQIESTYEVRT